jgi:hypothetical protein
MQRFLPRTRDAESSDRVGPICVGPAWPARMQGVELTRPTSGLVVHSYPHRSNHVTPCTTPPAAARPPANHPASSEDQLHLGLRRSGRARRAHPTHTPAGSEERRCARQPAAAMCAPLRFNGCACQHHEWAPPAP